MKFKKEFLQGLAGDDYDSDTVEIIYTDITDTSRWSIIYESVFKFDGKFYRTYYSVGATESQDERPYDYDDDEIECLEVFPVEKTITVYEVAK